MQSRAPRRGVSRLQFHPSSWSGTLAARRAFPRKLGRHRPQRGTPPQGARVTAWLVWEFAGRAGLRREFRFFTPHTLLRGTCRHACEVTERRRLQAEVL